MRAFLPGMLDNPELRTDAPASVVVFEGPTRLLLAGNPRNGEGGTVVGAQEATHEGVVCVLLGDYPIVYLDVDTSGMRTP